MNKDDVQVLPDTGSSNDYMLKSMPVVLMDFLACVCADKCNGYPVIMDMARLSVLWLWQLQGKCHWENPGYVHHVLLFNEIIREYIGHYAVDDTCFFCVDGFKTSEPLVEKKRLTHSWLLVESPVKLQPTYSDPLKFFKARNE